LYITIPSPLFVGKRSSDGQQSQQPVRALTSRVQRMAVLEGKLLLACGGQIKKK
jgi:hypothetical protein